MAKWGEGDPRWIVEERPDSTNVNNWHWTEKNCFGWSEKYLREQLVKVALEADGISSRIEAVTEVEGESTVGNRKGKMYFIFDLNLTLKWKAKSGDITAEGKIKINDMTQDDEVEEYNYKVTCDDESSDRAKLRDFVYKKLLPEVKKVLLSFRTDIRTEHEKNVLLPTKQAEKASSSPAPSSGAAGQANAKGGEAAPQQSAPPKVTQGKTIKMTVDLLASGQDIFQALTQQERLQIWTRSPATISLSPGSPFSLFGNTISGEMISVVPNKKIEQKWRLKDWPEGHFSHVTLELEQGSSSTEVSLVQTGVPAEHLEVTEANWHRFFWNQLKGVFGWGVLD